MRISTYKDSLKLGFVYAMAAVQAISTPLVAQDLRPKVGQKLAQANGISINNYEEALLYCQKTIENAYQGNDTESIYQRLIQTRTIRELRNFVHIFPAIPELRQILKTQENEFTKLVNEAAKTRQLINKGQIKEDEKQSLERSEKISEYLKFLLGINQRIEDMEELKSNHDKTENRPEAKVALNHALEKTKSYIVIAAKEIKGQATVKESDNAILESQEAYSAITHAFLVETHYQQDARFISNEGLEVSERSLTAYKAAVGNFYKELSKEPTSEATKEAYAETVRKRKSMFRDIQKPNNEQQQQLDGYKRQFKIETLDPNHFNIYMRPGPRLRLPDQKGPTAAIIAFSA